MKLIKPSTEILEQKDLYKHIELCGRVCYKSEDKITEDSAQKFVENIKKSEHGSVLEHGTIYLTIPYNYYKMESDISSLEDFYLQDNYSRVDEDFTIDHGYPSQTSPSYIFITTNLRVLVENNRLDDLKYISKPTDKHEKRVSVRFICDRGISHELVRHRVFSFSQESTRYCNYSKDKFDGEVTFIIPSFFDTGMGEHSNSLVFKEWESVCSHSERAYKQLLKWEATPQQARSVLPNSLKTELIMTGFVSDWKEFFKLRTSNAAHPQMRELAIPLEEEFKKLNLI